MPENTILLSLVMPCLNEERTVGQCVSLAQESFKALGIVGEVIVADNNSTDQSAAIARASGARVLPIPVRGYGAAIRGGVEAAQGRFIIMGDSDLSYDFTAENIRRFLQALEEGADLVMGNRYAGGIKPGAMPFIHQHIGTPLMTWAINRLFRIRIGDINCGMRGFTKSAFERLNLTSDGMELASEMIIRAVQEKLTITEIPTSLSPDGRAGKAHLRTFRDGMRHVKVWLKLRKAK